MTNAVRGVKGFQPVYTDPEIIAEMQRIQSLVQRPLTTDDMNRLGNISVSLCQRRFGSWVKAKALAGIPRGKRIFAGTWYDCLVCEKKFRSSAGAKSRRCCSVECTQERMRRKANFKGDAATLQAARGRAASVVPKTKCKECSGTERLEIHHKDRNPYNSNIENLLVVCFWCHRSVYHGQRPKRRPNATSSATSKRSGSL